MQRLKFRGIADNIFRVATGDDTVQQSTETGEPLRYLVRHEALGLIVTGCFATATEGMTVLGRGCWHVGVEPLAEGQFPPWPVSFERDSEGGFELLVDAPDEVSVQPISLDAGV